MNRYFGDVQKRLEKIYINMAEETYKGLQNLHQKINGKMNPLPLIIGISGGLDSSFVLSLLYTANQIAHKNNANLFPIKAFYLPYKRDDISKQCAQAICNLFDVNLEIISIEPQIKSYLKHNKDIRKNKLRIGNKCARERMAVLFDQAAKYKGVVIGTSNKSEIMLGYGTLFGDIASSFNPISGLFKSELYEISKAIGIPLQILDRPPTAGLWDGQTDEKELGASYFDIDPILVMIELDKEKIKDDAFLFRYKNMKISKNLIKSIQNRVTNNRFKSQVPYILPRHNYMYGFEEELL